MPETAAAQRFQSVVRPFYELVLEQDPYSLTPIQQDILRRTSLGESLGSMSCALEISLGEAYAHQRAVAWKFGTTSNNAMTNRAIQRGIISIEPDPEAITATDDEKLFMRLLASGRNFGQIGRHFNHASRDTVAFLCTHMAIMLNAKVDVANEEAPNLVKRAHEAGLIN